MPAPEKEKKVGVHPAIVVDEDSLAAGLAVERTDENGDATLDVLIVAEFPRSEIRDEDVSSDEVKSSKTTYGYSRRYSDRFDDIDWGKVPRA